MPPTEVGGFEHLEPRTLQRRAGFSARGSDCRFVRGLDLAAVVREMSA